MKDDEQLLRDFTEAHDQSAFEALVRKHVDFVYTTALRIVNRDAHLAQDVTQSVFIDLARKASHLPRGVVLAGWLHQHTCYTAAKVIRAEQRRRAREKTAMELQKFDDSTEPSWTLVAPYLDEGLSQLKTSDRDALVLRFLNNQDLHTVGVALGIGEDAAQKRVSRALEKLRKILSRRIVGLTTVSLTSALAAEASRAAPAGLVAGVISASTAKGTGTIITVMDLMTATKLKTGIVSAIVVTSLITQVVIHHQAQAELRDQSETMHQQTEQLAQLEKEQARLASLLSHEAATPTIPDSQFNEVLGLRNEAGRLLDAVREMTGQGTNVLSRDEVLASMRELYCKRMDHLKQLFRNDPAQAVPELQYLTDQDWCELVQYDHHQIDPDDSHAMSSARGKAQIHFAITALSEAVQQYAKNNDGQFPAEISQLTPYLKAPVENSVLQGWTVMPTSSLPAEMRVEEDRVITQKTCVNPGLDQRVAIGLKNIRLGTSGGAQWGILPQ